MLSKKDFSLEMTIPSDIPDLLRIIRQDEYKFMPTAVFLNESNLGTFLLQTPSGTTAQAFTMKQKGEIVGLVVLSHIHPVKQSCYFRLLVVDETKHKIGYGIKAAALIMNYCWNTLNVGRVWGRTYSTVTALKKAYELMGFVHEGTERKESFINGEWVDCEFWAVLKEEFNFDKLNRFLEK